MSIISFYLIVDTSKLVLTSKKLGAFAEKFFFNAQKSGSVARYGEFFVYYFVFI